MHACFQVAGFQNERDIRNRSQDFVCLFLPGHLLVQVTGRSLPLTAAKFRLVWKISDLSMKTSPRIFATYFLILKLSSLYPWYMGRLFFNTQTPDLTRQPEAESRKIDFKYFLS